MAMNQTVWIVSLPSSTYLTPYNTFMDTTPVQVTLEALSVSITSSAVTPFFRRSNEEPSFHSTLSSLLITDPSFLTLTSIRHFNLHSHLLFNHLNDHSQARISRNATNTSRTFLMVLNAIASSNGFNILILFPTATIRPPSNMLKLSIEISLAS